MAIGLGLPRGHSSYVLIKYDLTTRKIVLENDQLFRSRGFLNKTDGYTWYVCDAISGQRHELRDVGCPLKTVDYVFDNENVSILLYPINIKFESNFKTLTSYLIQGGTYSSWY